MIGAKIIRRPAGHCLTSDAGTINTAAWLDEMAGITRNAELRRAARLLVKPRGGRPPIAEDAEILAEIRDLIVHGTVESFAAAYQHVMRTRPSPTPETSDSSVYDRLRGKYRLKFGETS
jgi:hypothetical protein